MPVVECSLTGGAAYAKERLDVRSNRSTMTLFHCRWRARWNAESMQSRGKEKCVLRLGVPGRSSFPKAKVSRSMRVSYRGNSCAHRHRASVSSGKGLPPMRNKRLRLLSPSPADEFSALQAQLPSLVLHDPLWTQKLKLCRSKNADLGTADAASFLLSKATQGR